MVYHDDQPVFRLEWDDGVLAGTAVLVNATSLDALIAVQEADRRARRGKPVAETLLAYTAAFVEHVHEWNLHAGGRPVPVTAAAFRRLDRDVVVGPLMTAWRNLVLRPPRAGQDTEPVAAEAPQAPAVELELVATNVTAPVEGEVRVDDGGGLAGDAVRPVDGEPVAV